MALYTTTLNISCIYLGWERQRSSITTGCSDIYNNTLCWWQKCIFSVFKLSQLFWNVIMSQWISKYLSLSMSIFFVQNRFSSQTRNELNWKFLYLCIYKRWFSLLLLLYWASLLPVLSALYFQLTGFIHATKDDNSTRGLLWLNFQRVMCNR